jgi:hypothetical protein
MARDSQAALVALNRFGLGARGGASGDFVNAASDPRGFVKADLGRPNAVLLEVPGLLSTPALAQAVFEYQFEVKQARDAAAKSGAPMPGPGANPESANPQRRNLSLNKLAMEMAPKAPAKEAGKDNDKQPAKQTADNANAAMTPAEPMRPNAAKAPPQPLNVIQKTFRAEALARLQRAVMADCGFAERLVVFWSNHFCISANKGGLARMWAGSFEREAIRPHVLGRFADMLKAVEQHPAMLFFLDNQQSLGPDSRAGQNRHRGLNENLAREIMELHTLGVGGGYTSPAGALPDGRENSARPAVLSSTPTRTSRGRSGCSAAFTRTTASRRAKLRSPISRGILRPQSSSRPNSPAISSPTIRRPLWWRGCRMCFTRPTATSRRWRRHWWIPTRPGRRRGPSCAAPMNSWWRAGGCYRGSRTIPVFISAALICWASRCGRRPGRTDFPTPMRHGPRPKA